MAANRKINGRFTSVACRLQTSTTRTVWGACHAFQRGFGSSLYQGRTLGPLQLPALLANPRTTPHVELGNSRQIRSFSLRCQSFLLRWSKTPLDPYSLTQYRGSRKDERHYFRLVWLFEKLLLFVSFYSYLIVLPFWWQCLSQSRCPKIFVPPTQTILHFPSLHQFTYFLISSIS